MTDNNTYIQLPDGGKIEREFLLSNVEIARKQKWEYKKWVDRPALVDKKTRHIVQLYRGEEFDKSYWELKQNAWGHDHCEVCGETIADYTDNHKDGYFNGEGWICKSCYQLFIVPTDIEEAIKHLKIVS